MNSGRKRGSLRGESISDAAELLTQEDERLQSVTIEGSTVVLSAYDVLPVGTSDGVSADWRTNDGTANLYLFAEGLALAAPLQANGGIVSAHALVTGGQPAIFDVSGKQGTTPIPQPGGTPQQGGDGGKGGCLGLYLEDVDPAAPPPRIIASGGQGGGGQPGDASKDGGTGGTGGQGGNVAALISHPGLRWIEALKAAYALTDLVSKQQAIQALLDDIPEAASPPALPVIRAALSNAVATAVTLEDLNDAIDQAGLGIQGLVDDWKARFESTLDVAGGAPGPFGAGANNGSPGQPGTDGSEAVALIGALDAARPSAPPLFSVHPSQCAMTLAKAKLGYLFLDPVRDPQGVADAAALLERVRARTAPFVALDDGSDLAKHYRQLEASLGAVDALGALRRLNAEASLYLSYLKKGLDFFGYASDYVPLTSLTSINNDGVRPILEAFKSIEVSYKSQFAQLAQEKQVLDYVQSARRQITSLTAQGNVDIPELVDSLASSATIIDGYQAVLPDKRKAVDDALDRYEDAIRGYFNFNWQTLLTALGQIAFAPESGLMYLAQAAQIGYSGFTSVDSIQGEPVRKDFLVQQITSVKADVDSIVEGYETLNDGTLALSDPGANKLLGVQSDIEALLSQLYGKFPEEAADLESAIRDYVSTVIARNNQVLAYNAALTLAVQYTTQQQQLADQAAALNDKVLETLAADVPGLTAFVSQAYYSTRAKVLEFMDLAARAYRFWALEDGDLLRDSLGGTSPPEIDANLLDTIQVDFWDRYTKAIGDVGSLQVFPEDPGDPGESLVVEGSAVEVFKKTGQLLVSIPPARKETSTGPFLNKSNVRVRRVRAYINGASTANGKMNMTITHTGSEQIVNRRNQVFHFQHKAISEPFVYYLATRKIDTDTSFQISATGAQDLALIGPYTYWHITVDPNHNPGLDLSKVTSVELDFHGFAQGYD